MKKILTLLAMLFVVAQTASSMPAYPRPAEYQLPDGTSITVQLFGDEFFNYMLSSDGYQLTSLGDGFLYYYNDGVATRNATAMRASSPARRTAAERSYVSSLRRGVDATYENVGRSIGDQRRALMKTNASGLYAPFTTQASKSQAKASALAARSIVVLCQYQDVKFQPGTTKTSFENLLNQSGYSVNGAIGSAKDYFNDNSFGAYNPTFDVSEIVTLPQTMSYYGKNGSGGGGDGRSRDMIVDACKLAGEAGVNFAQYDYDSDGFVDNVFVFYAGYNEAEHGPSESIWPHRWVLNAGPNTDMSFKLNGKTIDDYACTSELRGASGATLCGIGTFTHEFGHVLGLPDFYDTDGNTGGYGPGLYNTCVMSSGGYNSNGNIPPHYTGIERELVGWATMRDLQDANGILTISPIHTKEGCNAWKIETDVEGEYYYLEARQSTRWDKPITTEGLLIYQIDRSKAKLSLWASNKLNATLSRPCARLIESGGKIVADGTFGQLFYPGGVGKTSFLPGDYGFKSWSGNPLSIGLAGISQSGGTVTLRVVKDLDLGRADGTVKDNAGTTLVGVQVSFIEIVESQASSNGMLKTISKEQVNAPRSANVIYTTTTESNGRYVMANLPYAKYDVMFERAGYDSYIQRVEINAKSTTIDATLKRFVAQLLSQKSWSDGEVKNYLDMTGSMWVASSWNAADLVSVAGKKVGGIAVETASSTTYEARLIVNNSLKYTSRGSTVAGGRTIVYLPSMLDITLASSDQVRIEFKVESAVASIGLDAGPAVKGKGDLYSENGQSWKNLSDNGINSNLAMSLLFFKASDIPEMPSVLASPSQRSCVLQFSTVDGNITSWNLRYRVLGTTEWTELPVIKTTAYTIENLTHETTYDAQLEAVFGDKKSEPKEFTFKTIGLTAPFAAIGGVKGRYAVGESYVLSSVNIQAEVESTEWRWNGSQIRSESLTFGTAGKGRLDCTITYKDGKKETLSREIVVQ